ncbi:MAG: hypothetical protein JNL11_20210 [Bdellovibrionaceae bacterium]|nr:hypothetical protein [Pseudobdellovibrionaceae bacterium]
MKYTLEFITNGRMEDQDGIIKNESDLEPLVLKLDAEKYVNLAFTHGNKNILTISGGRQQYIVMYSDSDRFYELNNISATGDDLILIRTGHTIGKFPPKMVIDPFTVLKVLKEFYHTGVRSNDFGWKPLS